MTRQATRSSNTQSMQNVVTENLTKLSDVIRPTPYLVNGQQAGYRVYPGATGSSLLPWDSGPAT